MFLCNLMMTWQNRGLDGTEQRYMRMVMEQKNVKTYPKFGRAEMKIISGPTSFCLFGITTKAHHIVSRGTQHVSLSNPLNPQTTPHYVPYCKLFVYQSLAQNQNYCFLFLGSGCNWLRSWGLKRLGLWCLDVIWTFTHIAWLGGCGGYKEGRCISHLLPCFLRGIIFFFFVL